MSQQSGGTTFPAEWEFLPSLRRVVSELINERTRDKQRRVKIRYLDGFEESGYISRSTGNVKVPILIHNRASTGGSSIGRRIESIRRSSRPHTILWSMERDELAAYVHLT